MSNEKKVNEFKGMNFHVIVYANGSMRDSETGESVHDCQDGKGYRQLVDDCGRELARLSERVKVLEEALAAIRKAGE